MEKFYVVFNISVLRSFSTLQEAKDTAKKYAEGELGTTFVIMESMEAVTLSVETKYNWESFGG